MAKVNAKQLTGVVDVANGGTGATTAAAARTALGLGSSATLTAGTSANNVVQLDGTGKLPAVDGSALTGLSTGVSYASSVETQAGTLTNKAVTPKGFSDASLGYGQTWQNLTGSRAASTTYTNTTGKPIMVNVFYAQFSDSVWDIQLTIQGVVVARDAGGRSGAGTNGGGNCSGIVPPGGTYSYTGNITQWNELR